jgi:hypothetical protein
MSMIHCNRCDRNVDTDFEAEGRFSESGDLDYLCGECLAIGAHNDAFVGLMNLTPGGAGRLSAQQIEAVLSAIEAGGIPNITADY